MALEWRNHLYSTVTVVPRKLLGNFSTANMAETSNHHFWFIFKHHIVVQSCRTKQEKVMIIQDYSDIYDSTDPFSEQPLRWNTCTTKAIAINNNPILLSGYFDHVKKCRLNKIMNG